MQILAKIFTMYSARMTEYQSTPPATIVSIAGFYSDSTENSPHELT